VEANGNNPTFLTSIPVSAYYLALSPVRSVVAYELYQSVIPELYVMDDGGGASTKVSPGLPVRGYSWSPNGKQLAFTLAPAPSSEALYIANADGSAVAKISANLSVFGFAWSPDSKRLALLAAESAAQPIYAFYAVGADGNNLAKLTGTTSAEVASSPVWSPDSRTIAFARSNIFVADVISDTLTNLTNNSGFYDAPLWSPDGSQLAFFESTGLSMLEIASGEQHGIYPGYGGALVWSPRGDKLAFVVINTCCGPSSQLDYDVPNPTTTNVNLINADGSGHSALGSDSTAPAWSPSGKYLLYQDQSRGNVLMDIDSGKITETGLRLYGETFSWAPDESSLVYGNGDLYLLRLGPP
jgi:Tol biopolymer transport system component